ncbi:virB8 family protein [Qipengyuania sp. DSG2-2]|uniref:virB8 family protein n=1 Tax=Qipengyuania sp. DGS2-2 TaxID=3349631 RepID=UPI0036D34D5A
MGRQEKIEPLDMEVEDSWSHSVTADLERSRRRAWIVAAVAGAIAILLTIALVIVLPLKTVEPYTLLVDRQTGNVELLQPLDAQTIAPDAALTRSFVVQYVVARESYDAASVGRDYRKVALMSTGDARQRYVASMQSSNAQSPLSFMPAGGTITVDVRSVSSLAPGRSLVRFTTVRSDPGAQVQAAQYWAAIVDYGYSQAAMSEEDRLLNPLGFQVTRYRRDAETLPEVTEAREAAVEAMEASEGQTP